MREALYFNGYLPYSIATRLPICLGRTVRPDPISLQAVIRLPNDEIDIAEHSKRGS